MRIVLVNKYWYLRGGSERVLFFTKKLLEEAGHEVRIFGLKHEKNIFENEYFVPHVEYEKMNFLGKVMAAPDFFYNHLAKENFKKLLTDFQPDVVHFHNIYHQMSFSVVEAAEELNIPMVMTLHDYKMLSPNYTLFHHGKIDESMLDGKYYRCLLNNCMENIPESILATIEAYGRKGKKYQEKIAAYISPSKFLKNLCVKAGWKNESVDVIPNPLETHDIPWQEGESVAFAGRLAPEKGISVLLEAAAQTPDIPYKIAGTGPDEAKLKKLAQKLKLNNVKFVGWLGEKDMQQFIQNARLVVIPSLWYENYPYSILEAKAAGKIVLGSRLGGIPELLPEDCLFAANTPHDLAPLIKKWYDTPLSVRQERGQEMQKETREDNDPHHYLRQILDVYTRICSR